MRRLVRRCLFNLQLHRLTRYLYRKKIIILMYHGFTDKKIHEGIENHQDKHLYVEMFISQVKHLRKNYSIISLEQLIEHYTSGIRIPHNSVVITIDDGHRSNYTLAYPILKQFNVPATIFLTTDFIDNKEFLWEDRVEFAINMTKSKGLRLKIDNDILSFALGDNVSKKECDKKIRARLKSIPQGLRQGVVESLERSLGQRLSIDKDIPEIYRPLLWQEVSEMIKRGLISIGSHTCSHVVLTRCSPENMKRELFLSRQLIEKKTGSSCRLFCYPYGEIGDFDHRTKKLLKESGYSCGLTTVAGVNDEHSDVFELKRLDINQMEDSIDFIMTLSGVYKFIADIKRMVKNLKI